MSSISVPIVNRAGFTEIKSFDRDSLSPDDRERADRFLDAVEYYLTGSGGPSSLGTKGGHIDNVSNFAGGQVAGYYLETDTDVLDELANADEINPAEDHSG